VRPILHDRLAATGIRDDVSASVNLAIALNDCLLNAEALPYSPKKKEMSGQFEISRPLRDFWGRDIHLFFGLGFAVNFVLFVALFFLSSCVTLFLP